MNQISRKDFIQKIRSKYQLDSLFEYFDKIKDLNILVVGDTIIDVYQYGTTLGKSGKSPIVAFENNNLETYQGGILAIYNHLKNFCNVSISTGKESVYKKRYIQDNQKLFETYTYKDIIQLPKEIYSNKEISEYDIVLIADFGHGFINKELQHKIESEARYIALNTQFNAGNMGMNTINKYTHRNYVSIDFMELRLATSNQFDSIEDIIKSKFTYETVSITQGKDGVFLYRNNELIHMPALGDILFDSIGAGDAYLSLTTPLSYINAPLEVIGFIGETAGAIACTYPGNSEYIDRNKIETFIGELYNE